MYRSMPLRGSNMSFKLQNTFEIEILLLKFDNNKKNCFKLSRLFKIVAFKTKPSYVLSSLSVIRVGVIGLNEINRRQVTLKNICKIPTKFKTFRNFKSQTQFSKTTIACP